MFDLWPGRGTFSALDFDGAMDAEWVCGKSFVKALGERAGVAVSVKKRVNNVSVKYLAALKKKEGEKEKRKGCYYTINV